MKNPTEKSGKYQLRCIKKMRSCKQRFSFSGSTMCHSRSANSQRLCAYFVSYASCRTIQSFGANKLRCLHHKNTNFI